MKKTIRKLLVALAFVSFTTSAFADVCTDGGVGQYFNVGQGMGASCVDVPQCCSGAGCPYTMINCAGMPAPPSSSPTGEPPPSSSCGMFSGLLHFITCNATVNDLARIGAGGAAYFVGLAILVAGASAGATALAAFGVAGIVHGAALAIAGLSGLSSIQSPQAALAGMNLPVVMEVSLLPPVNIDPPGAAGSGSSSSPKILFDPAQSDPASPAEIFKPSGGEMNTSDGKGGGWSVGSLGSLDYTPPATPSNPSPEVTASISADGKTVTQVKASTGTVSGPVVMVTHVNSDKTWEVSAAVHVPVATTVGELTTVPVQVTTKFTSSGAAMSHTAIVGSTFGNGQPSGGGSNVASLAPGVTATSLPVIPHGPNNPVSCPAGTHVDATGFNCLVGVPSGSGTGTGGGATCVAPNVLSNGICVAGGTGGTGTGSGSGSCTSGDCSTETTQLANKGLLQSIYDFFTGNSTATPDPTSRTAEEIVGAGGLGLLDAAFSGLKSWQLPAHQSVCPSGTFVYNGHTFSMDGHCTFAAQNMPLLSPIFMVLWNIGALFIILKA